MAKGRKLTVGRSERLLGTFGYQGNNGATEESELGEADIWSMVDGDNHSINDPESEWSPTNAGESNGRTSHRRIPARNDRHAAGGLSLAFDETGGKTTSSRRIVHQFRAQDSLNSPRGNGHHIATSAPVNVPDWHKIYRVESVESLHESDDGSDDRDWDMVPPHEYLARSRNSAATSVFVGVGRTLKGRDMSRVRDAVWSQTGFDG